MPEHQNEDATPKTANSEHAISDYYDGVKELEMQGYESGVRKARTVLFVTAALVFAGEFISASIYKITMTPTLIGIAVIESALFVGLALWTRRKPYTAIMVGLIVFIGLWVLAIIGSGFRGAIGGIIVRVIIISYLISALKPAKDWEEAKRNR
ncbi:MAG: hypothetical protein E6H10_05670 [Bacteroidetes bacterium]|nr:MAG: hypothetical protein E6H10_05670 [Bacteroidota bacterium]